MKTAKSIISFFLVLTMIFSLIPILTVETQAATQKMELHGFYPSQVTFSTSMQKYIDSVDSVSFAWGRLYADLSQGVNTTLGKNGNTLFYYPKDYKNVLNYAKSKNKKIQLNIFCDSVNALKILPYKDQRAKAVTAIANLLKSDVTDGSKIYFDGIVIDVEGLQDKDTSGKPVLISGQGISYWYSQFLKELKSELVKNNKKLYVAVNSLLNFTGYNYKSISETADKMIVMAHDYEPVTKLSKSEVSQYTGYDCVNPIDSLAPIKKLQLAMEDIKKYVSASNLKKVMLQINFDAAQWRFQIPKGLAWSKIPKSTLSLETKNTPTYQMIEDRIQNKDKKGSGISYGYNNELETPFIQYYNTADGTQNILIYENAKSINAKIALAKQYGLGGISLWSIANIPDYTDNTSKTYGLNVWDSIKSSIVLTANTAKQTNVTFSDKVVENAVRKRISKLSGAIFQSDLNKVYRLAIPAGFKTLADLKKLPNLEYLDLSGTGVSDVSVLGSLKNLRVLYLQRNNVKDIKALKGLTMLELLSLNGNKITDISSLSGMAQLSELYIRENLINDISVVLNMKKLNILYLKGNKSTNYTKLANIKKNLLESDF